MQMPWWPSMFPTSCFLMMWVMLLESQWQRMTWQPIREGLRWAARPVRLRITFAGRVTYCWFIIPLQWGGPTQFWVESAIRRLILLLESSLPIRASLVPFRCREERGCSTPPCSVSKAILVLWSRTPTYMPRREVGTQTWKGPCFSRTLMSGKGNPPSLPGLPGLGPLGMLMTLFSMLTPRESPGP